MLYLIVIVLLCYLLDFIFEQPFSDPVHLGFDKHPLYFALNPIYFIYFHKLLVSHDRMDFFSWEHLAIFLLLLFCLNLIHISFRLQNGFDYSISFLLV